MSYVASLTQRQFWRQNYSTFPKLSSNVKVKNLLEINGENPKLIIPISESNCLLFIKILSI